MVLGGKTEVAVTGMAWEKGGLDELVVPLPRALPVR